MPKTLKEALETLKSPGLHNPYTKELIPNSQDTYVKYKHVIKEIKSTMEVQRMLVEIARQAQGELSKSAILSFIAGVVIGLEMGGIEDVASDSNQSQTSDLPN